MASLSVRVSIILVSLALLLGAGRAHAQTLRGRVIDATTGQPIADVRVELLRADGSRVAHIVTDPTGLILFLPRAAGRYRLQASHIAYTTALTDSLTLRSDEEMVVELKLANSAIALDPLTVVARRADASHEASYEGLYARFRKFPPIGSRRVFLPHDPEMANAIDVSDILAWSPRARGCQIVYWNGWLQTHAELAMMRLETPVVLLEGVEYYRSIHDAPLAYRDIPGYLMECTSFYVVALWSRTGRYAFETEPHYYPDPPPWHPRATLVTYHVRGRHAPGIGAGLELSSHQELTRSLQLGVVVRGTMHQLGAQQTNAMTSTLSDLSYRLPPGDRMLQLYVIGLDVRALPVQRTHVRVTTSARVQFAQRRFSLETPIVYREKTAVTSYGWGLGVTAGAEWRVGQRTTATAGLGQDWFAFRKYDEIERYYNPTASNWSATGLRLGLIYSFARE